MGRLTWEELATICGAVAAVLTGMRWLLRIYFNQQRKIDKARDEARTATYLALSSEIGEVKKKLQGLADRFISLYRAQNHALGALDSRLVRVEALAHRGPGKKLVSNSKGARRAKTTRSSSTKRPS